MDNHELDEKIINASKTILTYCKSRTSNLQDAEDLAQDIIAEIIKSLKNIRDDNAFYGFMWAVAGNVYKQWFHKKTKTNERELTDDIQDDDDNFDLVNGSNNGIYLLRRELSMLSEKHRRATILYYLKNKSCAEISSSLNISESMVKYLLFKSRKKLKEGMNMTREFGELSYNPKKLIPLYLGDGPNRFYEFMNRQIPQNIISACYNDYLNAQQISLETGIPLPYLEDEIKSLEDRKILLRSGNKYTTDIIIIDSDCTDEISRKVSFYQDEVAEKINKFLCANIEKYKEIMLYSSDYNRNALLWQLSVIVFRAVSNYRPVYDTPVTAWGEHAFLWCVEKLSANGGGFGICSISSNNGDEMKFLDWSANSKGSHHDFYGNARYTNIICDIAKGNTDKFSEYDLEAVAHMVRIGYVMCENGTYKPTMPVYTKKQIDVINCIVSDFITGELDKIIEEMQEFTQKVLSEHTPKHLQNQVPGIACVNLFDVAVSVPAGIMINKGYLNTMWTPTEMPTTFIVLNI